MFSYLKVGLRNLLKNRRRTFWTVSAIVVAQIAILSFSGYVEYTYWGMREGIINGETGHIQLYKKGFSNEGQLDPFSYMLPDPAQYMKELSALKYVKAVTTRVDLAGIISNGEKSKIFTGQGVIPDSEKTISTFIDIVDGANLSSSDPEGALLGYSLANILGVKVGDYVTLLSPTKFGGLNAVDVRVRGTIQTGTKAVDDMIVKIPMDRVERLLGANDVTKIILLLDDTKYTETVRKEVERLIAAKGWDLEMKTWIDLADSYWAVVKIYDNIFFFLNIVIVLVIVSSIINTLSMTVMERVTEIGTIRAIGMKRSGIVNLFLSEGFLLGVLGSIAGILIAIALIKVVNIFGIETSPPPGQNRGYTQYILVNPLTVLYSFSLTTVTALAGAILPALKAGRLSVVDALRYNQ
jgi:putative ABC transport system permease protein